MGRLQDTLTQTVADHRDEIDTVAEAAGGADFAAMVRVAPSGDWLVDAVKRQALLASVARLREQTELTLGHVGEEGAALVAEDPSTVGVISKEAVAAVQEKKRNGG